MASPPMTVWETPVSRHLSFRTRFLVALVLITIFEFTCRLYLVRCVVFVNEPETKFKTVLTEDVTHRLAVDTSESRSITECGPLAFVEGDRSCNTPVLDSEVVIEIRKEIEAERGD